MANKRMIRDYTASERINKLTPMAEVFFIRLCMKADDFGRFYGNPKILKSLLFPLKDDGLTTYAIQGYIEECESEGIIQVYTAEGKEYVVINEFGQRMRSMKSKFPEPPDPESVSEYLKKNYAIFLEQWQMKFGTGLIEDVFSVLDTAYHSHDFSNPNHIKNAFTNTFNKIKNGQQTRNTNRQGNSNSKQSEVNELVEFARANFKAYDGSNPT